MVGGHKERDGLFLVIRREPKFGSPEYYHLQIFNVVIPAIDKIGKERVSLFADMFAKELQAVRKAA